MSSSEVEHKVIEAVKIDGFDILTDTGFVSLKGINKTVPYKVWELKTKSFSLECADNHIVFKDNWQEVFVKDLKPSDKIITENGLEEVVSVIETDREENMYDPVLGEDGNQRYYANGILNHNSTIYTVFALHYAMYNKYKTILICANKEKTAKEILSRIKLAYLNLPYFLKIGCTSVGAKELGFENGSKIVISSTSADSARGHSCDVCFNKDSWLIISENGNIRNISIKELLTKVETIKNYQTTFNELFDNSIQQEFLDIAEDITNQHQLNHHIIYDNDTFPTCPICGKSLRTKFNKKTNSYPATCSSACTKNLKKLYEIDTTNKLSVLTPEGFKIFKKIAISKVGVIIRIETNSNKLLVSENHKLLTKSGWKEAKDIIPLDILIGIGNREEQILEIEHLQKSELVYDLCNVESKDHSFFVNNIVNHNCILDEAAFIPNNIMDEFVQSVFPTISSRPEGKIIAVSTPCGMGNWYAETWHKAIYQQNQHDKGDIKVGEEDDFRWTPIRFDWWEVPNRDEKWKQKQIAMFNGDMKKWAQEMECSFLGSASTLFEGSVITYFKEKSEGISDKFIEEEKYNRTVRIYNNVEQGHVYIMGVDISDGSGEDFSNFQIYDVTDVRKTRLVAVFGSNTISVQEFAYLCAKYAARYNCALISGERNGIGAGFFDTLWNTFEYENILCYLNDEDMAEKPGIYSTNPNKLKACMWAKNFLSLAKTNEHFDIQIPDLRILYEMEYFERQKNKSVISYAATKNHHDDYVMCMIWAFFPLIYDIADNCLSIKQTWKTPFGLEIPISFNPNAFSSEYTEDFIENRFINGKPSQISIDEDIAKREDSAVRQMLQDSIYEAILGNDLEDNW